MALHVSDGNFAAEVLEADRPVLVDELADDFKIVKLDVDSNPGITVAYNVRSMPTLIIFKNGVPVDTKVGAGQSRVQLIKWLESHAA